MPTNLTVNALDYEDYKAARDAGEYDLLYLAVSLDYPDEAVLLHWFASASESNYAKYNSEEFDEMLSKIDTETEESAPNRAGEGRPCSCWPKRRCCCRRIRARLRCTAMPPFPASPGDAQGLWDFGDAKYTA